MSNLARSQPPRHAAPSSDRERLKAIVAARSFRFGQLFRLVSGVESNVYFNMKPTMFDPEGAALMAKARGRALGAGEGRRRRRA